jgi:hypothetical protein
VRAMEVRLRTRVKAMDRPLISCRLAHANSQPYPMGRDWKRAIKVPRQSFTRQETIRFAKQAFDMENIRLLTYIRLQNMYALLMAALSFNMNH